MTSSKRAAGPELRESARVGAVSVLGALVGTATAPFAPWQLSILVGWVVTALVVVAWTWFSLKGLDAEGTRSHANREDDSRDLTRLLLSVASVGSLVGVATALVKSKQTTGFLEVALTVGAVGTVVSSWLLVHMLFTLRYARLYYTEPEGGIDFGSDEDPDFRDFAYVAFTVGMTFQVSDTDMTGRSLRRAVVDHALLSYLFGVVIIAMTINVVAGFVR